MDNPINNASGWVADSSVRPSTIGWSSARRRVTGDLDQVFAVDARGAALMIAEFARRHIARDATWGRMVGLTSGGAIGLPEEVSYGAAKAARENLTMSAAMELGTIGVTANVVHPPVTDTGWVTPEVEALVRESEDMYHVASPDQVAAVVGYLCTDGRRSDHGERGAAAADPRDARLRAWVRSR